MLRPILLVVCKFTRMARCIGVRIPALLRLQFQLWTLTVMRLSWTDSSMVAELIAILESISFCMTLPITQPIPIFSDPRCAVQHHCITFPAGQSRRKQQNVRQ